MVLFWGKTSDTVTYINTHAHMCTCIYTFFIYTCIHTHTCYLFTHLSVTYLAQRKYTKKEGGEEKDRKT